MVKRLARNSTLLFWFLLQILIKINSQKNLGLKKLQIVVLICSGFLMQSGPKQLNEQSIGVNYRALNDLFHLSEQRKDTFYYEISVQMIEIYNEQVRDLLDTEGLNKRYPFSILCLLIFHLIQY